MDVFKSNLKDQCEQEMKELGQDGLRPVYDVMMLRAQLEMLEALKIISKQLEEIYMEIPDLDACIDYDPQDPVVRIKKT